MLLHYYSGVDLLVREVPLSQGFSVAGSKFMALRATEQVEALQHPTSRTLRRLCPPFPHAPEQIIVGKCGLQVLGGERVCRSNSHTTEGVECTALQALL